MNTRFATGFALLLMAMGQISAAWAYGGGGGSAACREPKFFPTAPAGGPLKELTEFSFLASDTEAGSLAIKINGQKADAVVTPLPNGDFTVAVHPSQPITRPGKVQIMVEAKSIDGCSGFKAFYPEVAP